MSQQARVNAANVYRNIITNFSDPLEFVREAISNAIDADASAIAVYVDQGTGPTGQSELLITIQDDGNGMDEATVARFFSLGDSEKFDKKGATEDRLIGEKGFGTKIYMNSRRVELRTACKDADHALLAISQGHLEKIHDSKSGEAPSYSVEREERRGPGTEIRIFGYNHNDGARLGHEQLRDYILWFTKLGSMEPLLWAATPSKYARARARLEKLTLKLRGLGFASSSQDGGRDWEDIGFGHPFPGECYDGKELRVKAKAKKASPTDYYCRRFVREGTLNRFPGFRWQAVFSIEGNRVKYENPMVRRQGYKAPVGSYKVAERYGIWVCKDFIPIEQVNMLLPGRGTEYLKFHAFFNCQAIQLSADRTSIGPTRPDVRAAINEQILEITKEIFEDEGVAVLLESLDEEDFGERTAEQEKRDYARRVKQARGAKVEVYKSIELREPQRELGVVAMLAQLLSVAPELLPFRVLDWNNAAGLDILARDATELGFDDAAKFYVECKYRLTSAFNHSLNNVKYVLCWDTDLESGSRVTAVGADARTLVISPGARDERETKFFLSRPDAPNNVEVFVLRRLLQERLRLFV